MHRVFIPGKPRLCAYMWYTHIHTYIAFTYRIYTYTYTYIRLLVRYLISEHILRQNYIDFLFRIRPVICFHARQERQLRRSEAGAPSEGESWGSKTGQLTQKIDFKARKTRNFPNVFSICWGYWAICSEIPAVMFNHGQVQNLGSRYFGRWICWAGLGLNNCMFCPKVLSRHREEFAWAKPARIVLGKQLPPKPKGPPPKYRTAGGPRKLDDQTRSRFLLVTWNKHDSIHYLKRKTPFLSTFHINLMPFSSWFKSFMDAIPITSGFCVHRWVKHRWVKLPRSEAQVHVLPPVPKFPPPQETRGS